MKHELLPHLSRPKPIYLTPVLHFYPSSHIVCSLIILCSLTALLPSLHILQDAYVSFSPHTSPISTTSPKSHVHFYLSNSEIPYPSLLSCHLLPIPPSIYYATQRASVTPPTHATSSSLLPASALQLTSTFIASAVEPPIMMPALPRFSRYSGLHILLGFHF